jgi:molecular chaperone Hsp33
MQDKIIRGTAKDGEIRFFAAITTNLVEKASKTHGCTPLAAAALGRMLTAASMMGIMLKNESESVTVQINGGGEAGPIVTVGNSRGIVKGYISNPAVDRPLNEAGKLDVGGAVGRDGRLVVIKDMGLKEPYIGQVPITSGEIAEDLTYYFAVSEQTPSAVSLGVLVSQEMEVISAGGFIIQMMPEADDLTRDIIGYRLEEMKPVTTVIRESSDVNVLISLLLDGMNMKVYEEFIPDFICDCSRERVEKVIISLGGKEIRELAESGEKTELVCHFCRKKYEFTPNELISLLEKAR